MNSKLKENIAKRKEQVEITKSLIAQLEPIIAEVREQERSIVDHRCRLEVQISGLKESLRRHEDYIKDMEEELSEEEDVKPQQQQTENYHLRDTRFTKDMRTAIGNLVDDISEQYQKDGISVERYSYESEFEKFDYISDGVAITRGKSDIPYPNSKGMFYECVITLSIHRKDGVTDQKKYRYETTHKEFRPEE